MHEIIRCALYIRFSSKLQNERSVEYQLRKLREFARGRGWLILEEHIYIDREISGMQFTRESFDKMLTTAKSGQAAFTYILAYNTSRFHRGLGGTNNEAIDLFFRGVYVYFVEQRLDSGDKRDWPRIAAQNTKDYEYNEELANRTREGIYEQIKNGFSGGGAPYGYKSSPVYSSNEKNGRPDGYQLDIIEAEARTIRLIFVLFAAKGWFLKKISEFLNKKYKQKNRHIPPYGDYWKSSTILGILKNEKYCGMYVWNKTAMLINPLTGKKKPIKRPEEEWLRQQRENLRIIDDELWHKAQERLENHKKRSGHKGLRAKAQISKNLLVSLAECSSCHSTYAIIYGGEKGTYGCTRNHKGGPAACENDIRIHQQAIEQAVIKTLCAEWSNNEALPPILNEVHRSLTQMFIGQINEELLASISSTQKEIDNLSIAIQKGIDYGKKPETLVLLLDQAEKCKAELESRLVTVIFHEHSPV